MMASVGKSDKLGDAKSVPQDGRNLVLEQKQVEVDVGVRVTRKRKTDKPNTKSDPEEKPKTNKRRLVNEKENGTGNDEKPKKSKKNLTKTESAPAESAPAPSASAQNSLLPTVEEVCFTFGLNDVKIQYRDVDYQNLTNFKFFTTHVRPILAKENPKVPISNMMILVAAKWRDFSSQKEFIEQAPPTPPPPAVNTKSDPEEKPKTNKRRLANGKENGKDEKPKKSKKNPSKTESAPAESAPAPPEPTPAPSASAQNSLSPTVEEVCSTFGLNDVNIQYRDVDYQNLTNFKFFTKHVRPILAKENPKVSMVNMMMLVAAKWRDFSSQKQFIEQAPPTPPPPAVTISKKKEIPTVEDVCTAFGLKDVKILINEADDDIDLTKYRDFTQHVRSVLSQENPNASFGEISKLVAAKWREFSSEKTALAEQTAPTQPPSSAADPKVEEEPTAQEVCTSHGLKNVEIQYGNIDYENLTDYKSFTRYVRPILSKENPKVPENKLKMLMMAKWREFSTEKLELTEQTPPSPPPSPKEEELPSVQEVCATYDLKDVEIDYNEIDVENLTNYRSFTRHIRPFISKVNPKISANRILMLVAAKWREFSRQKRSDESPESDENKENKEQNYASKATRSRAARPKTRVNNTKEKTEHRVTRARSGLSKNGTNGQEKVSAGP